MSDICVPEEDPRDCQEVRLGAQRARLLAVGLALSSCFAIFTCFVSNNLQSRFQHRDETIQKEFAILEGKPFLLDGQSAYFPEFQNRILFAIVLKGLSNVSFGSVGQWYLALKLFSSFLAFLVFWHLVTVTVGASFRVAAIGLGALAYVLILEFNHGWEHPTDFPDAMFTSLFLWGTLRHRWISLALIAALASFSRESSVFAGLIWFSNYGFRKSLRLRGIETVYSMALCAWSYAIVIVVRCWFGGLQGIVRLQTLNLQNLWPVFIRPVLQHPTPSSWPVLLTAMLVPMILWISANRKFASPQHIRLLAVAGFIGLISITLASISELRIFIPSTTVLVFVATSMEAQRELEVERSKLSVAPA